MRFLLPSVPPRFSAVGMALLLCCSALATDAESLPKSKGHVVARLMFPTLVADDLNGREVRLPDDFPGDPTLVFIAFKQRQQSVVNNWVAQMNLEQHPEIPWVELPTINRAFRIMKGYVDNGMRSGITETASRARTISIYGQSDLMKPLGISDTSTVVAIVVRRSGEVLAMEAGDPDTTKIHHLAAALQVKLGQHRPPAADTHGG